MQITLPKWYDLHVHLRQGSGMAAYIQAQIDMGCAGVLAMPNTKPPVARVSGENTPESWSIESYLSQIKEAGGDIFDDIIVPLYLTAQTTTEIIEDGAKTGLLRAAKYYPPHGTTGAEHGVPFDTYMRNGVFAEMEKAGVVLCIHGEEHALKGSAYFDQNTNAERVFYQNHMPKLIETYPDLKVVCEHVTTKDAVDFVSSAGPNVAATITPQHLLYTVGDLIQGLKYHLFCLPVLKFDEDREALRQAAIAKDNSQFFAGTDSAPHTKKATDCGCAAGCFTGGIAPQLYAQAFEEAGMDLSGADAQKILEQFLCTNGPAFYGLKISKKKFTLEKTPQSIKALQTEDGLVKPLPLGLGQEQIPWSIV